MGRAFASLAMSKVALKRGRLRRRPRCSAMLPPAADRWAAAIYSSIRAAARGAFDRGCSGSPEGLDGRGRGAERGGSPSYRLASDL